MLHLHRAYDPCAQWAMDGFPVLLEPDDVTVHLWWALTELMQAADVDDQVVADDLMLLVDILTSAALAADLGSELNTSRDRAQVISLELLGRLQNSVGGRRFDETALDAATLRRALPAVDDRPDASVPAYVPPRGRLGGLAHIPLVVGEGTAGDPDADTAVRVLAGIAEALVTGRAHLGDRHLLDCPAYYAPPRVGWVDENHPRGRRIGVISADVDVVVVDPSLTIEVLAEVGAPADSVEVLGQLLADRWLMDSTVSINEHGRVNRTPGVAGVVEDGDPATWTWQFSTELWHPEQFTSGPDRVAPLRLVPNTRA